MNVPLPYDGVSPAAASSAAIWSDSAWNSAASCACCAPRSATFALYVCSADCRVGERGLLLRVEARDALLLAVGLVARVVGELARCLELRLLFAEVLHAAMPTRVASRRPLVGDPVEVVAAFDEVARTVGAPDQVEHRAAVRTLVEQHRARGASLLSPRRASSGSSRPGSTSGARPPHSARSRLVPVPRRSFAALSWPANPWIADLEFLALALDPLELLLGVFDLGGVLRLLLLDLAELVALLGRGASRRTAP